MPLTHINARGEASMVDVSAKKIVRRIAVASGRISLQPDTIVLIRSDRITKGDVLSTARIAAVQAAKKTSGLIPLCHNIGLDWVGVDFELRESAVEIRAEAVCHARTGVEMEALTAVTVAALTIYDMCKAVDKQMVISDIKLDTKQKHDLSD